MALDLYAGPLCRYHAGEWENVGQRAAREDGVPYVLAGADTRDGEPLTIDEIRTAVMLWRDSVRKFFEESDNLSFSWDEDPDAEYFTDRPGWPGYYGLLLAAARPDLEPLPAELPEELSDDEFFSAAFEDWEQSPFAHILKPELWLPIRENLVFESGYLTRDSMPVGTLQALLFQLRGLNESRFGMDARGLEEWSMNQPDPDADVDVHARYGLAVFMRAAEWAMKNNVPLILDY